MATDSPNEKALDLTLRLFGMELQAGDDARHKLVLVVNELIQQDFNRLLHILYRVDVDEDRLKKELRQHPDQDAAEIITDLLIERQLKKLR